MSASLSMIYDDCQLFHLFNFNKNIDINEFSTAKQIFNVFDDEKIIESTKNLIDSFPEFIKEIENTKFPMDDCKKYIKEFSYILSNIDLILSLVGSFKINFIQKQLFQYLKEIKRQLHAVKNKFEDYIDVLESSNDIKNGNTCSLEAAFSV